MLNPPPKKNISAFVLERENKAISVYIYNRIEFHFLVRVCFNFCKSNLHIASYLRINGSRYSTLCVYKPPVNRMLAPLGNLDVWSHWATESSVPELFPPKDGARGSHSAVLSLF